MISGDAYIRDVRHVIKTVALKKTKAQTSLRGGAAACTGRWLFCQRERIVCRDTVFEAKGAVESYEYTA